MRKFINCWKLKTNIEVIFRHFRKNVENISCNFKILTTISGKIKNLRKTSKKLKKLW